MEYNIAYSKNEKLEELDDKIADIFSDAIYSYIIRKGLLKRRITPNPDLEGKKLLTDDE